MRVIHFADLHIGVELYGRPIAGKPWSSRMQDFLDAFDHLVIYAIEEQVDAVIFAGDAYKAREPSQTHQREFAKRIRRLSDAGVATFLLVGNHDLPSAESRAHALEIFRTLEVPHVAVGDDAWFEREGFRPQILETRSGPLQVAFVPWPQVSKLLASSEEAANASIDQVNGMVEKAISELVEEQARHIDPGIPSILTCHLSLNDFLVRENGGSERWMSVGTAPTVLRSSLHTDLFDYVAMGHHHNNIQLESDTPCWYAGSMQPVDFGEAGQPKGFMTMEFDTTKPRGSRLGGTGAPTLHVVPSRRFVEIEVKPREADPTPEIVEAIVAEDVSEAVVKVEIHLSQDQETQLRLPEARKALADAHFVAGLRTILPTTSRSPLPPNLQPDACSPLETLETYLRSREVADPRRERLLAAATELIAESESVGA